MMLRTALLLMLAVSASAQIEVPNGIKATALPDHVWRFDRPRALQPAFWERLLSDFGIRPATTRPFGRSVAFLAGVAQYTTLRPELQYVESDMTALRNFLLTAGGFDTVFEVRNGNVRRTLIEDYMVNKFSTESTEYLTANDRLLFYYSGHGGDKQGRVGYLQFSSAVPGNFAGDNVLPLTQFQEWARLNVAKHLAIILDACASGLAVSAKGGPSPEALLNALSGQGSGFLLTAGSGDQKAWQVEYSSKKGYSVFTHALLEALSRGAPTDTTGLMTINEVFGQVEKDIAQFQVEQGRRMVPQLWPLARAEGPAKGTFVFLNLATKHPQIPPGYAGVLQATAKGEPNATSGAGIIEVSSANPGRLFLDNHPMGAIMSGETQQFLRQPLGNHQVRIEGMHPETMDVTVENGMIAHIAFGAASPIDDNHTQPVGTLVLESIEGSSGEVYIDEHHVGHLDANRAITISNVLVGTHRYRVSGPIFDSSNEFTIRSNETTSFSVRPEPPTNLTVHVQ